MRLFKKIIVVVLLLASGWAAGTLALDRPNGFVNDDAAVIDPAARQQLERALQNFEQQTSVEMAVVTVKSLDGNDVAEVANRLFNQWGIGKKTKNNGVLFLIAPNERRMRIEVGYGLEGQLTDAGAGRILDEAVVPYFKHGDTTSGILNGASAIAEKLTGTPLSLNGSIAQRPADNSAPRPASALQKFFSLLFFIIVLLVVMRNPWLLLLFLNNRGGGSGGGFGGGGFGGFGGGSSGGGGASRGW